MNVMRFPYCGYCGKKMVEVFVQDPNYDRQTGKRVPSGIVYWQCSQYEPPQAYHDSHWHDSELVGRVSSRNEAVPA